MVKLESVSVSLLERQRIVKRTSSLTSAETSILNHDQEKQYTGLSLAVKKHLMKHFWVMSFFLWLLCGDDSLKLLE